jgi:hypothetical protein
MTEACPERELAPKLRANGYCGELVTPLPVPASFD